MNDLTEREIQNASVKALRSLGYTVCVTSNGKKTANTMGTPDAFVWGSNHLASDEWLALEFKTRKGTLSPEQKRLSSLDAIHICRSVNDALRAVGVE